MKKLISIVVFLTFHWCSFGQPGVSAGFGFGRIIPTHREYPEIIHNSSLVSLSAVYQTNSTAFRWAGHYNFPLLNLNLSYQWLGNPNILGNAFGISPSMSFYFKKGKTTGWKFEAGSGIAFLNKPYHVVNNPQNNVYGSDFNFFFSLGIAYEFELKKDVGLSLFAMIPHYSAANLHQPNLGVNTFTLGVAVCHLRRNEVQYSDKAPLELPEVNKKIKPFLRLSYGLTRSGLNGPKYPVYVAGIGCSKLLNRYSRLNSGFEYIFNSARYHFMRHIYAFPDEEFKQASRFTWVLGYEWLFGHVGFLAEAGLYLNSHYGQQSLFTTKLGFNFYPHNTLERSRFLPFFGAYVRAYAGEADFLEMTAGFMF